MAVKENTLKMLFKGAMGQPALDDEGNVIRFADSQGNLHIYTRGMRAVDEALRRAERGDMFAFKVIAEIVEPKSLRLQVDAAITHEHTLNPILQQIVDRLRLPAPKEVTDGEVD